MLIVLCISLFILIGLIVFRVNAFVAFLISAIFTGLISGLDNEVIVDSIEKGLGNTLGGLAVILGFGAVIGRLLAVSGAARRISTDLLHVVGDRYLPWTMMVAAFLIGLPMFFSVGFVLLVPILFSIAKKANVSVLLLGIPMLASLSITHGLLPPHPGPVALVEQLHADMGKTLLLGLVIALPAALIAGPLFARRLKNIPVAPLDVFDASVHDSRPMPGMGVSLFCALLPIFLLLSATLYHLIFPEDSLLYRILLFTSKPLVAMLLSVLAIGLLLGLRMGMKMKEIMRLMEESISGIAMILFIIGGAGAYKEVLVAGGLADVLVHQLRGVDISPILLCWGMAALIRLAVGSATVAALNTVGMLAPLLQASPVAPELLVLAIGSGSIFFSHVNDGGFWLVKEYFGLSIRHTLLTWSLMETILSICGLAGCLLLNLG